MYSYPLNLDDNTINNWSFWKFQENINLINNMKMNSGELTNINADSTYDKYKK